MHSRAKDRAGEDTAGKGDIPEQKKQGKKAPDRLWEGKQPVNWRFCSAEERASFPAPASDWPLHCYITRRNEK